jgi:adenine-specific DNA-methyltransferase
MANFFDTLLAVLKADERFFSKDGSLLRNKVYETAMNMDAGLIHLLLGNEDTKRQFFTEVDGIVVFDKIKFGWVVNNRQFLPDSYTRYKNRIGLTDSRGEHISQSGNVVLSFPYADCVLAGGQTKEDQRRDEIFYNATLAPDEVDRLLYPKVLVNARRYTYSGGADLMGNLMSGGVVETAPATDFLNTDNLIIKGNNLLAISSLLRRFEGKVKCIYIDPPYNTGSDSFGYNDNFNHSTWLVFMRNRLQVAKQLLAENGFLFVQIDNYEMMYIKVLLDEIFGRENFVNDIIWKRKSGSVNPKNKLNNLTDYILCYSKSPLANINLLYTVDNEETQAYINERFKYKDENGRRYRLSPIISPTYSATLVYNYKGYEPPPNGWSLSRDKMKQFEQEGRLVFPKDKSQRIQRKQYLDEYKGRPLGNLWSDIYVINPMSGERLDFVGQKPEALIQRVFEMSTEVGDLVLDFHLGSGTTAAVAHKMNRRYIGVEQMDYIKTITIERLKKVIKGEQGGISKIVGWHGGGSFVYCELAKCNQSFIDEVAAVSTDEELIAILDRVLKTGFISVKVNPKDISDTAADFAELSITGKKRFIIDLLDKNMLYVNLCNLDDEDYAIDEASKAFTRSFYGLDG